MGPHPPEHPANAPSRVHISVQPVQHGWQCRTEKRHGPARPLASPSPPTEQRLLLSNGIPPSLLNQPCPSQLTSPEPLLPLPALVVYFLLCPPLLPPTHPRLCLLFHLVVGERAAQHSKSLWLEWTMVDKPTQHKDKHKDNKTNSHVSHHS